MDAARRLGRKKLLNPDAIARLRKFDEAPGAGQTPFPREGAGPYHLLLRLGR